METESRPAPAYVTGLVQGLGSFTYSRAGPHLSLYFAVKLTASEPGLLDTLRRYFGGAGEIYAVRKTGTGSPTRYYRISRLAELRRVLDHFDRHPLHGRKARAYRIWREMVIVKVTHFRHPPHDRLRKLARRLSRT